MKRLLILIFCFLNITSFAKGTNEFFAEDFANQSVFWVQNAKESKQCQAVRILPTWYLTAAHCVRPICDKYCKVTFQLISGPLQAFVAFEHSGSVPQIFVPTAYRTNSSKSIRSDIALIHFIPSKEDYWYVDAAKSQPIDPETFMQKLNSSTYAEQRNQWQALTHARPTLLRIGNIDNRHILQPLAVPDLRSGEIYFKQSNPGDFYYFTQLRHYIGPNFGVEKGMSGSAVVLPGGNIIGVVSASLNEDATMVEYNEKDEPVREIPYSSDYFLFTPLSHENITFIQATIHSFHEAGKGIKIGRIDGNESEIITEKLQDIFTNFSSEQDVMYTKIK